MTHARKFYLTHSIFILQISSHLSSKYIIHYSNIPLISIDITLWLEPNQLKDMPIYLTLIILHKHLHNQYKKYKLNAHIYYNPNMIEKAFYSHTQQLLILINALHAYFLIISTYHWQDFLFLMCIKSILVKVNNMLSATNRNNMRFPICSICFFINCCHMKNTSKEILWHKTKLFFLILT